MSDTEKKQVVKLLTDAVDGLISEEGFWVEMERFFRTLGDPLVDLAFEEAHHFWGNFHEHNLFLVKTKPDPLQLSQDKETLRTLARAIQEGWSIEKTEEALRRT